MFNFLRQGQLLLENSDEESVFEAAMEAGAEDVQPASDEDGAPTRNFKVKQANANTVCKSMPQLACGVISLLNKVRDASQIRAQISTT